MQKRYTTRACVLKATDVRVKHDNRLLTFGIFGDRVSSNVQSLKLFPAPRQLFQRQQRE